MFFHADNKCALYFKIISTFIIPLPLMHGWVCVSALSAALGFVWAHFLGFIFE